VAAGGLAARFLGGVFRGVPGRTICGSSHAIRHVSVGFSLPTAFMGRFLHSGLPHGGFCMQALTFRNALLTHNLSSIASSRTDTNESGAKLLAPNPSVCPSEALPGQVCSVARTD